MERITDATSEEDTSIPKLWEDRQINKAGWKKHKAMLLSRCSPGYRPSGFWIYEKHMEPPPGWLEPRLLYEMGELQGEELRICLSRFRVDYEDALMQQDREAYCRWHHIPPGLIEVWDSERAG
jgi:hypothetical protein